MVGAEANMTLFFKNLETCLNANKMTCKDLSRLIGITAPSITGWKKENSFPRVDIACKVAKIFNTTVEWLMTGEEPTIKTIGEELADSINQLPFEYQEILKQNIKAYQDLCFKVEKESIQNIS